MLKKMRLRFIRAAMMAFGIVMLVLVVCINLINYFVMEVRQDQMLDGIMEYEQMKLSHPVEEIPMLSEMPWADGPEADFTIRFFAVHCDGNGDVTRFSQDHISSVDQEMVEQFVEDIRTKDRARGYYNEYRYLAKRDGDGFDIVFLNVSGDQRFVRSLLWVSVGIAIVSLTIVFLLIVMFSRKAIVPYAKNMERQKRFITDAGHELKTPLTSISTSADILAMEYEGDEWVENIQKQTARLTRLVNDFVVLSRLDEETPFPEKCEFSVSEAAWETAEPFVSLAEADHKHYTQHIEENLKLVGDRSSFQQMLSILLDNAFRYSTPEGEIRLNIFRRHNKLYIEVYNTCELEDVKDLDRLFDRFYRPDESRSANTGGTGIGLSMAQAIVETHGGKITVKSTDGSSILFTVIL